MKIIKYEIVEDLYEEGLPTFYVLKKFYLFGFHLYSQLLGQMGKDIAFQDYESAKIYLDFLLEK